MRQNYLYSNERHNKHFLLRILAVFLLVSMVLCGCGKVPTEKPSEAVSTKPETPQSEATQAETSQSEATQSDPVNLEQFLLKERGKPYDQSDYKKFLGGENIIHEYAEFDCNLDHGYSKTVNDLVISNGKLYQANFNSVLANGKNIQEVGALPGKNIRYWRLTHDGEMGEIYLNDGSGYKISNPPFATSLMDKAQFPLFRKVYRYASDGKTLEDHTAEYLNADKVYSGDPIIAVVGGKVSLLFSGKALDKGTTGWNWYQNMGWREYIAFDLDLSAVGSETPLRMFNKNILMTNCAFYEIVYASKPLDDNEQQAQLAPDGSVSPYYPAAQHLNCNVKLRKLDLLTAYYKDVRNISTSHVITEDYTMLPIAEVLTDGYDAYQKYDPCRFYWDYNQE